jgi:hypothetical protein
MKAFFTILALTSFLSQVSANSARPALATAVIDCTAFKGSAPHPIMPGETIHLQVHGLVDGKCKFTQSMPNNGLQTCLFTEQHRNELKTDDKALQKYMMDEKICIITGY